MKEAQIFENWANGIMEGTWALPDTPEAQAKLNELMSQELIVGPDATNATQQLYDVIGDDQLFDILGDLADQDPRANIWDDTDVQARLQELGIQLNTTPEADEQQPVAPAAGQQAPGTAPEQGVAENAELDTMLKYAGVPLRESVLTDSTGHTLDHILKRFGKEVSDFKAGGEITDDLYHALYDYYFDDMPYGTKKARDGDPYEWVSDRLADELGMNEGAAVDAYMAGKSPAIAHFADQLDKNTEIKEGSCNSTMEGEYCPEHGLAECGMYEMGTVAGGMAPVVGEGTERDKFYYQRNDIWRVMDGDEVVDEYKPARYEVVGAKKLLAQYDNDNIDVTHVISPMGVVTYLYGKPEDEMGEQQEAYYESKADNALLARIKSLALLK
jgi:hypothetical protein